MIAKLSSKLRTKGPDAALYGWTSIVYFALFAPIVTTLLFAFNKGLLGKQTSNITGFTLSWFPQAWNDAALRQAVATSLRTAIVVAFVSCLLGTITGLALTRHKGKIVRKTLEVLIYLLLIVPEIVLGVSLLFFFIRVNFSLSLVTLAVGHTPFPIAVSALIVRSRAAALDVKLEDAASDLGANHLRTLIDVVLPQLFPALLAALVLSFTFSFDDVVTSLFLTTPVVDTLPVYLFGTLHTGVTPVVYAIAALMFAFTSFVLGGSYFLYRWQSKRAGVRVRLATAAGTGGRDGGGDRRDDGDGGDDAETASLAPTAIAA